MATLPCEGSSSSIDVASPTLHQDLLSLCAQLLSPKVGAERWGSLKIEDLEITVIDGGITNALYKVALKESSDCSVPSVLVRVFGKAGDAVCDRLQENKIFGELSTVGFGPAMLGVFANGRLEGWLEGRRPLKALEMIAFEPAPFPLLIAKQLAVMHKSCSPQTLAEVWSQLREWIALGKEVSFLDGSEKHEKLKLANPFPRVEEELNFLETILPSPSNDHGAKLPSDGLTETRCQARKLLFEQRFCHLDLLSGNIMFSEERGDVVFIDFEYATHSYVGLDIANHFNAVPESCLILDDVFDADKYYPSQDHQRKWLRAYFSEVGVEVSPTLMEELLIVLLDFALLAELRWVAWAVVQASCSPVDFDYLDYCRMRFEDGYLKYKQWRQDGGRP
eukprot:CAMPEP_0194766376 /NCGR_PEP_ID=MMETSP0323_2-20130528/31130_1 /TAXON_ID=2866 ORGANISM="Crypthecodinium cohnii, Strain Seligo" /NCGR_SAMPLE_ID=MMETSP0323_2 /ASSEMBLY_ACC=CAM_ASM_000346 /LENGTH=391 /DNA_ID=CAMNT_0039697185 /DNA_START=9 /DNA_END=1184 /DNA_ORIENTATION=-